MTSRNLTSRLSYKIMSKDEDPSVLEFIGLFFFSDRFERVQFEGKKKKQYPFI